MNQQYRIIGIGAVIVLVVGALGLYLRQQENIPSSESRSSEQTDFYSTNTPPQTTNTSNTPPPSTATPSPHNNMHSVTISTNYGDIEFQTYDADAPVTVEKFLSLAKKGFYNNLTFHRVIKGFMIQGGDPTGTGSGGPGYQFADELNPETESYKNGYKRGVVAMANAGPNTNGSQFFIMHEDTPLQHLYTIFGHVVKGQDVVDKIANVETGPGDRPVKPVTMTSVKISEIK